MTTTARNGTESDGSERNVDPARNRTSGSAKGIARNSKELHPMRPTGVEPATFGLKDRRSLGPRKDPLTTELRALAVKTTRAAGFEHFCGH